MRSLLLLLGLVACLLPPPWGGEAATAAPAAPAAPSVTSADRVHMRQGYTVKRMPRRQQHPKTGQMTEAGVQDAVSEEQRTIEDPKDPAKSIIMVPRRRVATGCRINQRLDKRGLCRKLW